MNKQFNNWKDYLVLFLFFISTSFISHVSNFITGKISKEGNWKNIKKDKKLFLSSIVFIIFVVFFILYEIFEII